MPLDPSIILKVNTPAETNLAAANAATAASQSRIAQNQVQQLPVTNQAAQTALSGEQIKNQSALLEQQQSKLSLQAQILGNVKDQASQDAAKQQASSMGLDVSQVPEKYDPAYIENLKQQSFTAAQRIQMQQLANEQAYKVAMIRLAAGRLGEKTANDSGTLGTGSSGLTFVPSDLPGTPVPGAAPNPNAPVSAANLPAGTLTPPTVGPSPTSAPAPGLLAAPTFGANGAVVPNPQNAPNPAAPVQDISKLQGKEYADALAQVNPGRASQLLAMANGEQPIPRSNGKNQNPIVTQLNQAYPGVNSARNKTFQDYFGGGKPQQAVNNLGTAIGHAGELLDKINELHAGDSFDSPITNGAANYINTKLGSTKATNFASVVPQLASEVTSLYRGAGGAEADIDRQIKTIGDPNASKEQQVGALNELVGLMASKTQAYKDQYDSSMQGAPSPRQFIPLTLGRQSVIDKIKAAAGSTGNTPGLSAATQVSHSAIDAELAKRGVK